MSVSGPHNEHTTHYFDAVQVLQLLEATGAASFPDGSVYRGVKVEAGRLAFELSHCDHGKRQHLGPNIQPVIDEQRDIKDAVARGFERLSPFPVTDLRVAVQTAQYKADPVAATAVQLLQANRETRRAALADIKKQKPHLYKPVCDKMDELKKQAAEGGF